MNDAGALGTVAIVGGCGHVGLPLGLAFASRGLDVVLYDLERALGRGGERRAPCPSTNRAHPRCLQVRRGVGSAAGVELTRRDRRRRARRDRDRHTDRRAPQPRSQRGAGCHRRHRAVPPRRSAPRAAQHRVPGRDRPGRAARGRVSVSTSTWRSVRNASPRARRWSSSSSSRRSSRPARPEPSTGPAKLFGNLAHDIVYLEPEEAELAKLFTNTWRYIKFAASNQLYMMANDFGLDFERIRSALAYNYPRAADLPRAGFAAGPCLFKDTMQLAAFNNNNFHLGQASVSINEGLPLYVVARLEQRYDLSTMTRRHPRYVVQGRVRRHPLQPELQAEAHPQVQVARGAHARSVRHDRSGSRRRRPRARATPTSLLIGTPHAHVPRPRDRRAGGRHLEPARGRSPGVIEPTRPRVSIVIPVYNEGESIVTCLDRIVAGVTLPCEVLVVYDDESDTTVEPLRKYAEADPRVVPVRNTYGRGPARAIRYGIDHVQAPVAVVTMADGSDDAEQIDELCKLVERGVVVAAASRYMSGGQQIDGPMVKTLALAPRRSVALLVRARRYPRRHQLVQGVLGRVRARRRTSIPTRASRSGSSSWPRPAGSAGRLPRSRPSGSSARRVRRTSRWRSGSPAT